MGKRKSQLQRQLEESIRRAKAGTLPVQQDRDSLLRRLQAQDGLDIPDSLADPLEHPPLSDDE
jgi:hypothetical protein